MPRNALCYEVLIASPSDVKTERQIIVECIEDWNSAHSKSTGIILQARRWELDAVPDTGTRPQDLINRQIVDSSDILLGVFWSRLGTQTGVSASGTVEEIERFVAAGKPVSLYFSQSAVPILHDHGQLSALLAYKRSIASTSLHFEFNELDRFRRLVSRHLAVRMNQLVDAPAEERIANVEMALLQLQQKVRGREVTPKQVDNLKSATHNSAKGIVTIQKLDQDAEAVEYAQQLFDALKNAGWTPVFSPGRTIGGMEPGLSLSVYSQEALETTIGDERSSLIPPSSQVFYGQVLRLSLAAVGIVVDRYHVASGPPIPRNSVYLAVGSKP